MVSNIKINISKDEYPWLENFSNQKEAEEHVKRLIDVGQIVYNLLENFFFSYLFIWYILKYF